MASTESFWKLPEDGDVPNEGTSVNSSVGLMAAFPWGPRRAPPHTRVAVGCGSSVRHFQLCNVVKSVYYEEGPGTASNRASEDENFAPFNDVCFYL